MSEGGHLLYAYLRPLGEEAPGVREALLKGLKSSCPVGKHEVAMQPSMASLPANPLPDWPHSLCTDPQ